MSYPRLFDIVDDDGGGSACPQLRAVRAGADWYFSFQLRPAAGADLEDLGNGRIFSFQARRDDASALVLFSRTNTNNAEMYLSADRHVAVAHMTALETRSLQPQTGVYTLSELTNGRNIPLLTGKISITRSVAR